MMTGQLWAAHNPTYRAREMKIIAGWISAGESGSVVGLPGCGRANLLGFLCHRLEVLQSYLPPQARSVALIPVDLNILPANNLSTLYRVVLRSFYRVGDHFDQMLQQTITTLYQENRMERDPFLLQSALQDLLLLLQAQRMQVVLVLNRFDRFCQMTTPQMVNTLRGLRDNFKDTLSFIVGMSQEVAYLPDPTALGNMYELVDSNVCWVGAMNDEDARNLIARAMDTASQSPSEVEVTTMLALSGGFPSLLRAICNWWLTTEDRPATSKWAATLLAKRSIRHRLTKIWSSLTQEEQFVLSEVQRLQTLAGGDGTGDGKGTNGLSKNFDKVFQDFSQQQDHALTHLVAKGVCDRIGTGWRVAGELLAAHVERAEGRGRGKVWLDEQTEEIYQGPTPLKDLTSLERSVLSFLVRRPRIRHTKTDLIISTWPDELRQKGVSDNSLYQMMLTLRRKIEPNPSEPRYLITWRGKPEGGYQFFPEGRPG
jgi:hypothetical protein